MERNIIGLQLLCSVGKCRAYLFAGMTQASPSVSQVVEATIVYCFALIASFGGLCTGICLLHHSDWRNQRYYLFLASGTAAVLFLAGVVAGTLFLHAGSVAFHAWRGIAALTLALLEVSISSIGSWYINIVRMLSF